MVFRDRPSANTNLTDARRDPRLQGGIRYRLMQNLASVSDPVVVQTDEGAAAFTIERMRKDLDEVLVIRDPDGTVRCSLPEPQSGCSSAEILGADSAALAHVNRTPISAVRDRFEVDLPHGTFWLVIGDVGAREFTLDSPNSQIAEVSRRWFLRPESFGVQVSPGQDDALVLAVAATIDLLAHGFDR